MVRMGRPKLIEFDIRILYVLLGFVTSCLTLKHYMCHQVFLKLQHRDQLERAVDRKVVSSSVTVCLPRTPWQLWLWSSVLLHVHTDRTDC